MNGFFQKVFLGVSYVYLALMTTELRTPATTVGNSLLAKRDHSTCGGTVEWCQNEHFCTVWRSFHNSKIGGYIPKGLFLLPDVI
jgi:hypothetical protein